MPVHDFGGNVTPNPSAIPYGLSQTPSVSQLHHAEGLSTISGNPLPSYSNNLDEFIQPGFRALDEAMKRYWTGLRVPTKDSYRFMRVKIAGGDKSLMVWSDDLNEGRALLPLAAISRDSYEFNKDKFSPAYHAMTARYVSTRRNMAYKVFRPVPYFVDYSMMIWAEHKRDIEYILYQVLTRFNPIAEFKMFDGRLVGNVQLILNSSNDASDKEIGYDQHANVRYEISMKAEAWLPLPEKLVPTVLGSVTALKEKVGAVIDSFATGYGVYSPVTRVVDAKSTLNG